MTPGQLREAAKAAARSARQQARAEAAKATPKAKPAFQPSIMSCGSTTLTSNVFTVTGELAKMRRISADDIGSTALNAEDFKSLGFDEFEAGFFIAEVPWDPVTKQLGAKDEALANKLLHGGGLKVTMTPNSIVLSTYCTFDRVQEHYQSCLNGLSCRLIGFSTPRHCLVLAERV